MKKQIILFLFALVFAIGNINPASAVGIKGADSGETFVVAVKNSPFSVSFQLPKELIGKSGDLTTPAVVTISNNKGVVYTAKTSSLYLLLPKLNPKATYTMTLEIGWYKTSYELTK